MEELRDREEFSGYNLIRVPAEESYACNCVLVNERRADAGGISASQDGLAGAATKRLPLDMSEFRKMDGGLSCLSLRF